MYSFVFRTCPSGCRLYNPIATAIKSEVVCRFERSRRSAQCNLANASRAQIVFKGQLISPAHESNDCEDSIDCLNQKELLSDSMGQGATGARQAAGTCSLQEMTDVQY
jgi:hypothetical protein